MTIGGFTPLQQATPLHECFSINDVRTLVAKQLGVELGARLSVVSVPDVRGAISEH
jgi:hypothetical protein